MKTISCTKKIKNVTKEERKYLSKLHLWIDVAIQWENYLEIENENPVPPFNIPRRMKYRVDNSRVVILRIKETCHIIGWALLDIDFDNDNDFLGSSKIIISCYINKKHRRRGYGSRLVSRGKTYAETLKMDLAHYTSNFNPYNRKKEEGITPYLKTWARTLISFYKYNNI